MRYHHRSCFSIVLFCAASHSAAAPLQKAMPSEISHVLACRDAASDKERLACYDQSTAALAGAITRQDVTVIDKQELGRTRRSLFGFSLPNLALFGLGDSKPKGGSSDLTTFDGQIHAVRKVSYGKWDIQLDGDAVWRNIDLIDVAPSPGEKVHIEKSMLGGFFFKIGSDRPIRAERIH